MEASVNTGKLYLVSGASAAGKSTVVTAVATALSGFVVVKKATTRQVRESDPNEDAYFYPELRDLQANDRFLIYATNGSVLYGMDVGEIRHILDSGRNALLVSVHHGARQQLEEQLGRERVVEVFIHRDLTASMRELLLQRGGLRRLVVRERLYEEFAKGLYRPDYVVLNCTTTARAVAQFRRIVSYTGSSPWYDNSGASGVLHIVVAATGTLRDMVQAAPFAIPGWGRAYCKKDTPSAKEVAANPLPPGWMEHSLFGRRYRLHPAETEQRVHELGVAFVMFSDITSARALQYKMQEAGIAAPMHYLHQDQNQVEDSVIDFPMEEWEPRLRHAAALQQLYEEELILQAHPILPVNGSEGALDWCYRCINERSKHPNPRAQGANQ